MGYYDPTQTQVATPQVDLSGINQSLSGLQNNLANMQKMRLLQQQQDIENQRADAQLAIQQAQAKRQQDEYDRKVNQRNLINTAMKDPNIGQIDLGEKNLKMMDSAVDKLYDKYKGYDITSGAAHEAFNKDYEKLMALENKEIIPISETISRDNKGFLNYNALPDKEYSLKHYGTQNQVKDTILKDLLSKGIDYSTAVTLADTKAKSLVPTVDTKTIADNKKYQLELFKAMYPNKSGTTVNVGGNGVTSTGKGTFKVSATNKNDPEAVKRFLDTLPSNRGALSMLVNSGSNDTTINRNKIKDNMQMYNSNYHVSPTEYMAFATNAIKDGIISGPYASDKLFSSDPNVQRNIATLMKNYGQDSTRTTTSMKTRGNGGFDYSSDDRAKALKALMAQNQALDLQGSPNVDTGLYGIEHAFDGQKYKPLVTKNNSNKTKTGISMFSGTDALSKAMLSKVPNEVAKLSVNKPSQFSKLYDAMTKRQQKKVDKVLQNKSSKDYFSSIKEKPIIKAKETNEQKQISILDNINSTPDEIESALKSLKKYKRVPGHSNQYIHTSVGDTHSSRDNRTNFRFISSNPTSINNIGKDKKASILKRNKIAKQIFNSSDTKDIKIKHLKMLGLKQKQIDSLF